MTDVMPGRLSGGHLLVKSLRSWLYQYWLVGHQVSQVIRRLLVGLSLSQ